MISILCEKHLDQRRRAVEAYYAAHPGTKQKTGSYKVGIELLTIADESVDTDPCSDCKLYGLSNRGIVEELDSPNDWFLGHIFKENNAN